MELAVAETSAIPSDPTTAVAAERLAEAPFEAVLTVKLTTPPATGSVGSIAVTVTASELANEPPVGVPCGVLPGTTVRTNP